MSWYLPDKANTVIALIFINKIIAANSCDELGFDGF